MLSVGPRALADGLRSMQVGPTERFFAPPHHGRGTAKRCRPVTLPGTQTYPEFRDYGLAP